jgi:hypothetical protein
MPCNVSAEMRIHSSAGTWSAGDYAVVGALGSDAYSCHFTVPDGSPLGDDVSVIVECEQSGAASTHFVQDQTCRFEEVDDELVETCAPHPGSFMLLVRPLGAPRSFQLSLSRDGTNLLDKSGSFTYRSTGSDDCGTCPRGSADLTAGG